MRALIVTAVALLLVASASFATVTASVTNLGPVTGLTGYTAWLVSATSDAGKITAIDAAPVKWSYDADNDVWSTVETYSTINGYAKGIHAIGGAYLNQAAGALDTNVFSTIKSPTAGNALRSDTHFTYSTSTALAVNGTAYNDTSALDASFGLDASVVATSVPVAYVVLANGQQASYAFAVGYENAVTAANVSGLIPEPATMAVLVIGGIGALLRRRK